MSDSKYTSVEYKDIKNKINLPPGKFLDNDILEIKEYSIKDDNLTKLPIISMQEPIKNNNDVDINSLSEYVKNYFENIFNKDLASEPLKPPEKPIKELKVPSIGELSKRTLKTKEDKK